MKDIILVDLDGTLADCAHRRHFVTPQEKVGCSACNMSGGHPIAPCTVCKGDGWLWTGNKPDWKAFFAACVDDTPLQTTIDVVTGLHQYLLYLQGRGEVWIISGRSDEVRTETIEWLSQHEIPYNQLIMRPAGTYTPDDKLKRDWLHHHIPKERVFCVFDDRDKVVEMWRSEGLICYQVAEGDF